MMNDAFAENHRHERRLPLLPVDSLMFQSRLS